MTPGLSSMAMCVKHHQEKGTSIFSEVLVSKKSPNFYYSHDKIWDVQREKSDFVKTPHEV